MSAINSTINYLGSFLGCQSEIVNKVCDPDTWKTLPRTWNPLTFISPGKEFVPGVCRNVTTLIECSELVKNYVVQTGEDLISTLGLTTAAALTIGAVSRFSDKKHTVLASMTIAGAIGGAKLLGTTGDIVATAIGGDAGVPSGVGLAAENAAAKAAATLLGGESPVTGLIGMATRGALEWLTTAITLPGMTGATTALAVATNLFRPNIFAQFTTDIAKTPGMQALALSLSTDFAKQISGPAGAITLSIAITALAKVIGLSGGKALGVGTIAASSMIGIAASQRTGVSPISAATGIASSFIPDLLAKKFPYTAPVKIISSIGISTLAVALTETAIKVADQIVVVSKLLGIQRIA